VVQYQWRKKTFPVAGCGSYGARQNKHAGYNASPAENIQEKENIPKNVVTEKPVDPKRTACHSVIVTINRSIYQLFSRLRRTRAKLTYYSCVIIYQKTIQQ
jgi:hypothetical protein